MNDAHTTTQLLDRIGDGDAAARDALLARYLPRLRAWAHRRLPAHGRDLAETDDLVQVTLLRALNHLKDFESRRPGALLAWLRTILMNVVRDEIRHRRRMPEQVPVSESTLVSEASAVEAAVGAETMQAYEAGLRRLDEDKRMAVIMRVEFGMSFEEIARELERPSANATRMMVVRALQELAEGMPP